MSDPLSIAAGVVGILGAAGQISSMLIKFTRSVRDASSQARVVITEVNDVSSILSQLQTFILGEAFANRSRALMLKVDQIVNVISGCVLTFSDLEKLLDEIHTEDMSMIDRLKWERKESTIAAMIQRLQNHKASLSLILNVLNAGSIIEANDSVERLHVMMRTHYQEIAFRLQMLERHQAEQDHDSPKIDNENESIATLRTKSHNPISINSTQLDIDNFDFSEDLQNSRVYRRNRRAWHEDGFSLSSKSILTGSWSCLSDLSLADVSTVSVINLPVTVGELLNTRRETQTWTSLFPHVTQTQEVLNNFPTEVSATSSIQDRHLRAQPTDSFATLKHASLRDVPRNSMSSSLYPWSQHRLNFFSTDLNYSSSQNNDLFPRYGAAASAVSTWDGNIYVIGGLVNGVTTRSDLWSIKVNGRELNISPVRTSLGGPGPRVGHACLAIGNAFIVFGGDTITDGINSLDETLYLLNTSTHHWMPAPPSYQCPPGRYGHTLNILGSRLYVFGGQNTSGKFFSDLTTFDLGLLSESRSKWEFLLPKSRIPSARTNHTVVTWNDKLYLFGGTDDEQWFNDVWIYEPTGNHWSQLDCVGSIPAPREGHSATLVGDIMYIFGGRSEIGTDLGDLAAFVIPTRRWFTLQNMGPSPSPRSGHSMTACGKDIVVLGGEPNAHPGDPDELSLAYILDTSKIRYPR